MSNSDARRLIEQGGVEFDNEKHFNPVDQLNIKSGTIMKVGKRDYYKLEK